MKKILALPLVAVAVLVSQAWSAVCTEGGGSYCQFDTGCYEMSTEYSGTSSCTAGSCTCEQILTNCKNFGAIYSGVTNVGEENNYGDGVTCNGTWTGLGNDPTRTALGCCQWETETNCYTIWSGIDAVDGIDGTAKVTDCNGGSNVFWNGACLTSGTGCPSGTPVYNGKNPTDGYCCWEANEYNDYIGSCNPISSTLTVASCEGDYGTIVSSCGSCQTSGTPILKTAPGVNFVVAPYGRSLHISSAKDATISLYDMSGVKVFSGKVRAGNSVFSLDKVSSGSYYAIVQSGSDSKKVPVVLK